METPKIYVVNLNSYNNGRTRGKWYELPVDFSRIKSDLLLDVEHGEEYAIHDFENFYATIDTKEINSINLNDSVVFEINSTITFNAILSYYEISNAFYDKEDDEWYGKQLKTVNETFSVKVVCLAKFNYNLYDDYFEFNEITFFEVEEVEEV